MSTELVIAAILVFEALQLGIFAYVLKFMEQGRRNLIDALIARSPTEYVMLQKQDTTKAEITKHHPVIDDEFEALLEERRKQHDRDLLDEQLVED